MTVRAVLFLGQLTDLIDHILFTHARVENEQLRDRYVEYILLQAAYKANLFYVRKLELQCCFGAKAQRLFDQIADRIKEDIYAQARVQLGASFFYSYEYELEDAHFRLGALRLTLHRTEK